MERDRCTASVGASAELRSELQSLSGRVAELATTTSNQAKEVANFMRIVDQTRENCDSDILTIRRDVKSLQSLPAGLAKLEKRVAELEANKSSQAEELATLRGIVDQARENCDSDIFTIGRDVKSLQSLPAGLAKLEKRVVALETSKPAPREAKSAGEGMQHAIDEVEGFDALARRVDEFERRFGLSCDELKSELKSRAEEQARVKTAVAEFENQLAGFFRLAGEVNANTHHWETGLEELGQRVGRLESGGE
jgi:chromosome segregation ATPase